jgi:predicted RND superfamily exporter protein
MKLLLARFSIKFPWLVVLLVLLLTGLFGSRFPQVHFDNDPENMLAADEPVRQFHHQVKQQYALYDFVIVGISNETHPDGIFNVATLQRIYDLTYALTRLQRSADGLPVIAYPGRDGAPERQVKLDLTPASGWQRGLNTAFAVDPNRLFTEQGESAIIAREIISPSLVDNLKQAELGSLRLEYLMEHPPQNRAEALAIRDDAMHNPLYYGTLVAEDGKALCLYLPIREKTFSYNVATLVRELTTDWDGGDEVHITGLPVAEDTFGVEMLVQMATSAPLAMLAIFLLLLLFFKRLTIVIAPMLVALGSVICTMGLLIGLGFDVHIMSSMIAIFLMPIAVADSVHILSEFYDSYHRFGDKRKTLQHVVEHLFTPMLYTTLTTMAGFGSLMFTPIPPVKVFGAHVAFGVGLAWLLTMTLVPAYVMLAISDKSLQNLQANQAGAQATRGSLTRFLEYLGRFSTRRWRPILLVTLGLLVVAAIGISRIQVNDNPVKWFTEDHEIRQADTILNRHFGGTYTAYLTLAGAEGGFDAAAAATGLKQAIADAKANDSGADLLVLLDQSGSAQSAEAFFVPLAAMAAELDDKALPAWQELGDAINYLDPQDLTPDTLAAALKADQQLDQQQVAALLGDLRPLGALRGEALLEAALNRVDRALAASFGKLVRQQRLASDAPLFKRPEVLRYLERLQTALAGDPTVGKSSSVVDALKKGAFELQYRADQSAADNRSRYAVPETVPAVAQVFTQLEGMKKKDALFHLVTRDYQQANLWVQLKSGDNKDMEAVVAATERYLIDNPPPVPLQHAWAGLTYLNVVWQEKMVTGMLWSLGSSFIVVLVMMVVLFRSLWFGILAMLPLSVTITLIYGLIGLVGKDYDMPVAVLSAMTLGLSVDFAIHFLERARQLQQQLGIWQAAATQMFKEPAMAISRNAIIISIGFTPLLVAPLVPYKTVGFFLATIMAVSWLATLFLLPALLTVLRKRVFPGDPGPRLEDHL